MWILKLTGFHNGPHGLTIPNTERKKKKKVAKYCLRKCPKFLQLVSDMRVPQIDMQQYLIDTCSPIIKIKAKEPLFLFLLV